MISRLWRSGSLNLLAVRQFVDHRHAFGFMRDAAETTLGDFRRYRCRRIEPGLAEVDAETGAPDRDILKFAQVGVRRNVIVLIAFIAFHRAEIDETGLFERVAAVFDFPRGQADMNVRPVRGLEPG